MSVKDDITSADIADVPIEGTQWMMDWELTPEQRAKARIPEPAAPVGSLPPTWRKHISEFADHLTSSTST